MKRNVQSSTVLSAKMGLLGPLFDFVNQLTAVRGFCSFLVQLSAFVLWLSFNNLQMLEFWNQHSMKAILKFRGCSVFFFFNFLISVIDILDRNGVCGFINVSSFTFSFKVSLFRSTHVKLSTFSMDSVLTVLKRTCSTFPTIYDHAAL